MENIEFEFIDRAISVLKDGYNLEAAKLISDETALNMTESQEFIRLIHQMSN